MFLINEYEILFIWCHHRGDFVLEFEYPKEEEGTSNERCISTGWQQKKLNVDIDT